MIKVIRSPTEWRDYCRLQRKKGLVLGFVPTMGALHAGHRSLINRSTEECDISLVSIFVNPTQFNNPQDLQTYPRQLQKDLEFLEESGVTAVFTPSEADIYPDAYHYKVEESQLSHVLCGQYRPGHFTGMLTIVLKLLNLTGADLAYFGEKDFQQLQLIKGMCQAFFLDTQIVGCPTVREKDGLAMSSRNTRLSPEGRALAPKLYQELLFSKDLGNIRERLTAEGFKVEYLEEQMGRRLAAVWLDQVRLIDNVPL